MAHDAKAEKANKDARDTNHNGLRDDDGGGGDSTTDVIDALADAAVELGTAPVSAVEGLIGSITGASTTVADDVVGNVTTIADDTTGNVGGLVGGVLGGGVSSILGSSSSSTSWGWILGIGAAALAFLGLIVWAVWPSHDKKGK